MDGRRFDELARVLAKGSSRRTVLKGIAGGLIGGLLGGGRGASAQRVRNQAIGNACASATECALFRCVDGVCCNSACMGQCEACNLPGLAGTCSPVSGAPAGNRAACPGQGICAATCDGQNQTACAFPGVEVICGQPTCVNGRQETYACGGNGTCLPTTTSCAPLGCNADGTACASGCATSDDCAAGAVCANSACVPVKGVGEPCGDGGECQSGVCADDVCCAGPCDGGCEACNLPGNIGFCTPRPDGADCANGACCDSACIDTDTSPEHCGGCDRFCPSPTPGTCQGAAICAGGTCGFAPAERDTVCREAAGDCDAAEVCDGTFLDCPLDQFLAPGTKCREAGPCDEEGFCTGSSADCPSVAASPDMTPCGPDQGPDQVCCAGICCAAPPANATTTCVDRQCGFVCDTGFKTCAGGCIPDDVDRCCTVADCVPRTSSAPCQGDLACIGNRCESLPRRGGTVCREATEACEEDATCDGQSFTCPPNPLKEAGTVCRKAVTVCDVPEECTGQAAACPDDELVLDDTTCGSDLICCGGVCVANTTTANCGACGNGCDAGQVCSGGQCVTPCREQGQTCGGQINNAGTCCAELFCVGAGFNPGSCLPCRTQGQSCGGATNAGVCCDDLVCNDNFLSGNCHVCRTQGQSCGGLSNAGTCCGGLTCFGQSLSPGTCEPACLGQSCDAGNPCCDGTECCGGQCITACDACETCDTQAHACVADTGQNGVTCGTGQVCCDGVCCTAGQICVGACQADSGTCQGEAEACGDAEPCCGELACTETAFGTATCRPCRTQGQVCGIFPDPGVCCGGFFCSGLVNGTCDCRTAGQSCHGVPHVGFCCAGLTCQGAGFDPGTCGP